MLWWSTQYSCIKKANHSKYNIIWYWMHAADIETCHYIKILHVFLSIHHASQNTNLFKVELWPGFTWRKKNHCLSHGWLGVKKFEWTQYRLYCPCTNLSRHSQTCFNTFCIYPAKMTAVRNAFCHRWSFLRMFRSWLELPNLSCGEVFLFWVS